MPSPELDATKRLLDAVSPYLRRPSRSMAEVRGERLYQAGMCMEEAAEAVAKGELNTAASLLGDAQIHLRRVIEIDAASRR